MAHCRDRSPASDCYSGCLFLWVWSLLGPECSFPGVRRPNLPSSYLVWPSRPSAGWAFRSGRWCWPAPYLAKPRRTPSAKQIRNGMRTAYKVLAYIVAAEVAVQAMVMVWAIAGLGVWVDSGGVFDKSIMESGAIP